MVFHNILIDISSLWGNFGGLFGESLELNGKILACDIHKLN